MKFTKNEKTITLGTGSVVVGDYLIVNPTEEILSADGWVECEECEEALTDEDRLLMLGIKPLNYD
ncbi:MAG: hypothetical protein R3Y50_10140 [Rikenellaceae bacterium]